MIAGSVQSLTSSYLRGVHNSLPHVKVAMFREIIEAIKKKDWKDIKPCSGCSWICGRDGPLREQF